MRAGCFADSWCFSPFFLRVSLHPSSISIVTIPISNMQKLRPSEVTEHVQGHCSKSVLLMLVSLFQSHTRLSSQVPS